MTTEKQILANRENAKDSTGPKTEEGKEVSKMNALKHGLFCRQALVREGEKEEFDNLAKTIRRQLHPKGTLEHLLVDMIISHLWRLKIFFHYESCIVSDVENFYCNLSQKEKDPVDTVIRYGTSIERSLYKSLKELQSIRSEKMISEEQSENSSKR